MRVKLVAAYTRLTKKASWESKHARPGVHRTNLDLSSIRYLMYMPSKQILLFYRRFG